MNILVTGSRGFVGKRLVKALGARGHKVREFDIALGDDVTDFEQCKRALKGTDVVYHLAAVLDEESPKLFEVNVKGTENIAEAASKQRCRQMIYLGTAGVHGNAKGVVSEGSPLAPVTGYEQSKAKAEKLVMEFQEMVPVTVLRSALVFGPNKYWEKIIGLVRKGFPLAGGGKQQWQTIFVDDLIDALLFVLLREDCFGETFIVAEGEKHSLRELYAEIQRQLGMEVKVKAVAVWKAKLLAFLYKLLGKRSIVSSAHIDRLVRKRSYNTGKINALGWKARTGMREAVEKTVQALEMQD